jgi:hypothetical protein
MSNGYVSGFSPIDTSGIRMQQAHDPMGTSSGFDDVLGKVGMGLGAMGPAIDAGMQYGGLNRGAAITSAALMGFSGGGGFSTPGMGGYGGGMGMGGGGKFMSWGGAGGTSAKFLGGPGAPPGMGMPMGGMPMGGPGAPPGMSPMGGMMGGMMGGPQDTGSMDAQINSMFNNNMIFLAMQTKVQNVTQITQMTSNIAKADSDAKLNAIRNIRG